MPLIIDGYNLLHASGILGRGVGPGGLERARQALLNFLAESLDPAEIPRTTVVFDAGKPPYTTSARVIQFRGLTVRFSSEYGSADELIEELIQADSAPKRLTVVSSDHRLHKAAKRRRATAIDSDRWHAGVLRARRERGASDPDPAKPNAPSSEYEINLWLREFGEDQKS